MATKSRLHLTNLGFIVFAGLGIIAFYIALVFGGVAFGAAMAWGSFVVCLSLLVVEWIIVLVLYFVGRKRGWWKR